MRKVFKPWEDILWSNCFFSSKYLTMPLHRTMSPYKEPTPAGQSIPGCCGTPGIRREPLYPGIYDRTLSTSRQSPRRTQKACPALKALQTDRSGPHGFSQSGQSSGRKRQLLESLPPLLFPQNAGKHRHALRIRYAGRTAAVSPRPG